MQKATIEDIDLQGKRVFIRVDFNVPLTETGEIREETRITAALPTIRRVMEKGGRVILASHLGRPKGAVVPSLSLKPIAKRLAHWLKQPVPLVSGSIGPEVAQRVAALQPGDVLMLENVRFHPGETENDPTLAAAFARLADVVVNDAFGTAHRAHASNVGVAERVSPAVAGTLMAAELAFFHQAILNPRRPLVAILGGAKVSSKITVIERLLDKVDTLLIGGAMAFTFAKAAGHTVGNSLVEHNMLDVARHTRERATQKGVALLLPVDVVVGSLDGTASPHVVPPHVVPITQIPDDQMGLDIGPHTCRIFGEALKKANTIVWNGPMGLFEQPAFANGTLTLAKQVAGSTALSIVGGGDTDAAVRLAGVADQISFISTGGGAFIELLEGKTLPGITILADR